jgi:hypothetical protein
MSQQSDHENADHLKWLKETNAEMLGEERARIEYQMQQDQAIVYLSVACRTCLSVRTEPSDLISKSQQFSANATFIFTCTSPTCRGLKRSHWLLAQPCGTPIAVNLAKLKPISSDVIEAPRKHVSPFAKKAK